MERDVPNGTSSHNNMVERTIECILNAQQQWKWKRKFRRKWRLNLSLVIDIRQQVCWDVSYLTLIGFRVNKENRSAGVLENYAEGEAYAEHSLRKFVRKRSPQVMPSLNKFFSDPEWNMGKALFVCEKLSAVGD